MKKESQSKVETNDESFCKGSLNSVIFGVRKPSGENYGSQIPWSAKAEEYHIGENNYSFDASQAYCFVIVFKTVM